MPNEHSAPPRSYGTRYWKLRGYPGESNGIDAASEATGLPLVGLVDDEVAGVIGYVSEAHADRVIDALNPDDRKTKTLTEREREIVREALDFYADACDDNWEEIEAVGRRIARNDKITLRNEEDN